MSETVVHVISAAEQEAESVSRLRTRTCVGCGERVSFDAGTRDVPDADLVRLVLTPGGEIAVDDVSETWASRRRARGRAGRGLHVHARPVCLERAARGGIARSTKGRAAQTDAHALARAIQCVMDQLIKALLTAAARAKVLVRGVDAVLASCRRDEALLILVARDATEWAELPEVRQAIADGRAIAWGDRAALGDAEMAAVLSSDVACALKQAVRVVGGCDGLASAPSGAPKRARGGSRNRAAADPRAARGIEENAGGKRRQSGARSNLERGA